MRRLSYVLAFMLLLSMSAFATGVGDVCVHINNGIPAYYDQALIGFTNTFEVWMANDAKLGGMSPALEISMATAYTWNMGYGSHPPVNEEGRAVGVWNLPDLQVAQDFDNANPEHVLMGGAAMGAAFGLPAGPSEVCYTLQFDIPTGQTPASPGISVSPYVYPPAGTWTFNDGVGYAPTFCGAPAGTESNPVGLVEFDIIEVPCFPPVWSATPAASVNRSHCMAYDFMFAATEGGNIPPADPVTYSGDNIAANGAFHVDAPNACGTDMFNVTATNACQGTAAYGFSIVWTNNNPDITNCPLVNGKIAKGNPWSYNFLSSDPDICDGPTWSVTHVGTAPVGGYSIVVGLNGRGEFVFDTDDLDGGNTYDFEVTVTDNCGGTDVCAFSVEVLATENFVIKLTKTHNSLQGHYAYIDITKIAGSEMMGGFDFLVGYDASALSFMSATIGTAIDADHCGWEYFTYRYGAFGNCSGPCPSGFARIVAIADINNGANHPACLFVPSGGVLATLKFYVTNNGTFECMYAPIRFAWQDCGDNAISSATGDTLFISKEVYDFEWDGNLGNPLFNITWIDCGLGYGFYYGGACPGCEECHEFYPLDHPEHPGECKNQPVRDIYFWNGGVDIACAESIDARGDINLNGIANEIADAVLFTNYFLQGIGVFDIALDGQIAATDVNNDGLRLSVGDLVYLIRVITGDALPFPKLAPFANSATVNVVNGVVTADAASDLGAVFAVFDVNGSYNVINHTGMELVSNEVNGELRVLVYSGMTDMDNYIPAGSNQLFTVAGNAELVKVEVSDYNGNLLSTNVNKTSLPTQFSLLQNVPNPFNPTTKITLELPTISNWNLDIYNVAGQLVKGFSGTDQGVVSIEWNASNVASGIYFYKMSAGAFTDTKKMVLMK